MVWKQKLDYLTRGAGRNIKESISGWTLMDAQSLELAMVKVSHSRKKFSVERPTNYSVSTVNAKDGLKLTVLAIQGKGIGSMIFKGRDKWITFTPSASPWQIPKAAFVTGSSAYSDGDDFLTEVTGTLNYDKELCKSLNSQNLNVSESVDLLRSKLISQNYVEE
jgi:hypothetical protein